jgi:hypothetical protein
VTEYEIEDAINRLVDTRYPHEVAAVLAGVDPRDLTTIVAAALARSVARGRADGIERTKDDMRKRLGL